MKKIGIVGASNIGTYATKIIQSSIKGRTPTVVLDDTSLSSVSYLKPEENPFIISNFNSNFTQSIKYVDNFNHKKFIKTCKKNKVKRKKRKFKY